jgi:4-hydroxy-tetrahydrodipicolinate reductase
LGEDGMAEGVGIAVVGCSGRMGRMLVRAVSETPGAWLSGATERPGSPWIGRDLGEAMGGAPLGVTVEDDPLEVFARSQAVLDFTTPAATMLHAELAAQARLVHVIGTTGLEREQLERLAAAARHAVIVRAGNMSIGVNLLTVLVRRVAEVLGPDYDIEILEMHHRHKIDAPSGTALALGHSAAAGRKVELEKVWRRSRDGHTGARPTGEIGFATLRGGEEVGVHTVMFAAAGERLELTHRSFSREGYAMGAVMAARWLEGKKPGLYNMKDVLGL